MILSSHGLIASSISQGVVPPLNIYGSAAAAYSVRLLRTAYTGSAIRVRRTDSTESNIGFTSAGNLDTTALLAFTGTGVLDNGFITTWYDQSGNAINATQTTALLQPKIVNAGSLITQNGKVSLDFASGNFVQNLAYTQTQPFTAFYVGISDISEGSVFDGSSSRAFMRDGTTSANRIWASSFLGTVVNTQFKTIYGLYNGASSEIKTNNTTTISGNVGTNTLGGILIGDGTNRPFDGRISELIIYGSNQSTNQTGISTNINSYYAIY